MSDFGDRIGHGTAVAAAILEKATGIELIAVRVFGRELTTSASVHARGITWAAEQGARVINLSLGTPNQGRREVLLAAVTHATKLGATIVSAIEVVRVPYLPGSLPGVIGVRPDRDMPRDEVIVEIAQRWRASGFPRPVLGVAPKRNLNGVSFAVANASGFLARLLEDAEAPRDVESPEAGVRETLE